MVLGSSDVHINSLIDEAKIESNWIDILTDAEEEKLLPAGGPSELHAAGPQNLNQSYTSYRQVKR